MFVFVFSCVDGVFGLGGAFCSAALACALVSLLYRASARQSYEPSLSNGTICSRCADELACSVQTLAHHWNLQGL